MYTMCENNSIKEKDKFMNQVTYEKVIWTSLPLNFNSTFGDVKDFSIDDKLAFEIGSALLKKAFGETTFFDYHFIIIEVLEEDIFIVSALPPAEPNRVPLGGDYNVAINKKDGKIIKIWMGE